MVARSQGISSPPSLTSAESPAVNYLLYGSDCHQTSLPWFQLLPDPGDLIILPPLLVSLAQGWKWLTAVTNP